MGRKGKQDSRTRAMLKKAKADGDLDIVEEGTRCDGKAAGK